MTDSTNKNVQPEFGKKVRETGLTTKELADTLGVDVKTVNNTVERLLGNTFQKSEIKTRSNGKIFTEEQATAIKIELQNHSRIGNSVREETMSVKDVASVLNVTPEALKKHIRVLFPEIIKNGIETRLNEKQVTAIKQRMLPTTSVVGNVTDYEMELLTQKVLAYHIKKANEYKSRAEIAEQQLIEQQPKVAAYNNYLSRDKFCNFRDAANYLNIKQTDLMNLLKSKYIYKNSIGEYRAYSDYSDYFSLRPFERGKDKVGQQLMINIKGLEYFKKILAKEIIYA